MFRGRVFLSDRLRDKTERAADDRQTENGKPFRGVRRQYRRFKKKGTQPCVQSAETELPNAEQQTVPILGEVVGQ